jgi:hypothetical protein
VRVLIDTNILISAALSPNGSPAAANAHGGGVSVAQKIVKKITTRKKALLADRAFFLKWKEGNQINYRSKPTI